MLHRGEGTFDLERLGMDEGQLASVRDALFSPNGLLIVTGPTGSGKTTLLYSMLRECNAETNNIVTIEDPVEYMLPGIAQTHVNQSVDLTFDVGLRYQLRSDPDVVMCGEIRDLRTAQILTQTAMTGHLVLSALHTRTAPEVIGRLLNMGLEPFMVADTLRLVVATHLVRKICPDCKCECEPDDSAPEWLRNAGLPAGEAQLYRGAGCRTCIDTGYMGRTGLFEVMTMTDALRDAIVQRADAHEIAHTLGATGHRSLIDHGLEKVRAGVTTIDEVARLSRAL